MYLSALLKNTLGGLKRDKNLLSVAANKIAEQKPSHGVPSSKLISSPEVSVAVEPALSVAVTGALAGADAAAVEAAVAPVPS